MLLGEKGPFRVPFVRRNGAFVWLAQRRPCPGTGGIYSADGPDTAQGALTTEEQTGNSSMGLSVGFPAVESCIAESLPAPERPSEEAVARRLLTHMPYAAWCQVCLHRRESS